MLTSDHMFKLHATVAILHCQTWDRTDRWMNRQMRSSIAYSPPLGEGIIIFNDVLFLFSDLILLRDRKGICYVKISVLIGFEP